MAMTETVAVLGTGLIGRAMAERATALGHTVRVWNRTASKAEPLAALGATVCATPAEAARGAARVHVIVKDDEAVEAVLAALGATDALILDHTTASPAGTAARVARLTGAGQAYLHAPIFMSPANARAGRGVILTSGDRALFERAEPALAAMTGRVWWIGERPDLAAAYKLFGNATIIGLIAALADVFTLAGALGVGAKGALGLFDVFDPSLVLKYRGAAMAEQDFAASFELAMARKDVRLMLDAAGARPLAVLPAIAERMDALLARGLGASDLGVLAVDAASAR